MGKISQTDTTKVTAMDEPDNEIGGGANHLYHITNHKNENQILTTIKFQHGPVKEHDINGIRDEDLMHILRHRLIAFQNGEFACKENKEMLYHICAAINWEIKRTENRKARNVEGTSKK